MFCLYKYKSKKLTIQIKQVKNLLKTFELIKIEHSNQKTLFLMKKMA